MSNAVHLHLDHHRGEPIYRQIVEQVKYLVACGRLRLGDQLPSIRALAGQLKINPRTVVKAYEELGHAGVAVMRQGQGVFIVPQRESLPKKVRREALGEMTRRLLSEAARMGAGYDEVAEVLDTEARAMGMGADALTHH